MTEEDNKLTLRSDSDKIFISEINPVCDISFNDEHGEVGRLTFSDNQIHFTGNADESAKKFFDFFLKPMVDVYIAEKLKRENEPEETKTDIPASPDGS